MREIGIGIVGASLEDSRAMVAAAAASGVVNMVGFNYIRTPASQFARALVARGDLGEVTWFRGEHTEDFDADPTQPAAWRNFGAANGTMGDLAPHMINAALALIGPLARLCADIATVHKARPGADGREPNDDIGQFMCRFQSGALGHLSFSRVATGRKMGYAYEITGTKGAIRFDQEDQNALWLYRADDQQGQRGFRKILTGPDHPDYLGFCQGPGHGTGYQDQIIIEARDFLRAIETGTSIWPSFHDGMEVNRIIAAAHASARRAATAGRATEAEQMGLAEWTGFVDRIRQAAQLGADHGLTVGIHAHAAGFIDFEPELERFLDQVDDSLLKICFDTGHHSYAGYDPVAFMRRHIGRISYMHFKDIDPRVKAAAVANRTGFYEACGQGIFCNLGKGDVDFPAVRQILLEAGFNGWCTVEQDCDPAGGTSPIDDARANRGYLSSIRF